MRYLFPLICLGYASIFWVFYYFFQIPLNSLFPSILFSIFLFIFFAVFFLFSFSDYSHKLFAETSIQIFEKRDAWYYKKLFKTVLIQYSHYISYVFFYIWAYIVTQFFPWSYFSYSLLGINIFVILFFLSFKKLSFALDFLRINQIIFSLIYVWSYIYILFSGNNFFGFIDFVNSFIIILSFLLILKVSPVLVWDKFFIANFYLYIYFFIMFYLSFMFESNYMFFTITNIGLSVIFLYLSESSYLDILHTPSVRASALLLWYLGIWVGLFYLMFHEQNMFIYMMIIIWTISNFLFHKKYQNYISFFCAIVAFSLLLFIPSFWNINGAYNYIFIFFLSYFLILYTYFFENMHSYDSFFIHCMSYIYNFIGIGFFLVFYSPSHLQIAILMFFEFLYFFCSYYKLTEQKHLLKSTESLE